MDTDQIRKLTSYPDINSLLIDWVEGVKNILGNNVVGLYLSGSLTYGDFVPDRSDIDLQAVVKIPLTRNELKSIELLHKMINKQYPVWVNRIECSYVPLKILREILPPQKPRPWWGFNTLHEAAPAGNEWLINHYFLLNYGVTLHGQDFNSLIPPIDIKEVQKASARDLFKEWKPKINNPEWLQNSHYQSYLVLNLCRILHTVITSKPSSKKVAAEWTKVIYPQWKELIEEAENWRYGTEIKRTDNVIAFIKFTIKIINETGILE